MLNIIFTTFINLLNNKNFEKLNTIIDDDCLFINYDNKSTLSKSKTINTFIELFTKYNIHDLTILNNVKDDAQTLLISYSLKINTNETIFGSLVVRINKQHKIYYLKNFIVK